VTATANNSSSVTGDCWTCGAVLARMIIAEGVDDDGPGDADEGDAGQYVAGVVVEEVEDLHAATISEPPSRLAR
jgi:hypothetical protein